MTATPRPVRGLHVHAPDEPGDRRFVSVGPLDLERGGHLPEVVVAYETWGTRAPDGSNAVLVEHALTGDSHVVGPAGPGHPTPGWWQGIIGPGRPLDTDRWFVVAANILGGCRGTTGPSSRHPDGAAWGSRFPFVTVRDQVAVEALLADELEIPTWHAVLGGSMGGMRVLEWAATHPERVEVAIVLASTLAASADQIAWCRPQLAAIRSDPAYQGGDYHDTARRPDAGLGVARMIAHTTYRSGEELELRFGRSAQGSEDPLGEGGRYAVESYLDHHATKLAGRFDPGSYVVLTEAMNSHDVGRGRGGAREALAPFAGRLVVAGVDSDRLYTMAESERICAAHPHAELHRIHSPHGHDGFLIEIDHVGAVITAALRRA